MSALHNLARTNGHALLERILRNYYGDGAGGAPGGRKAAALAPEAPQGPPAGADGPNSPPAGAEGATEAPDAAEGCTEAPAGGERAKEAAQRPPARDAHFVDRRDSFNRTPLHLAAFEGLGQSHAGHVEAAKALIRFGADVNAPARNGMTALHFAAQRGHAAMLELLCRRGARVGTKTNSCATPVSGALMTRQLHLAVANGHVDCAAFLFNKKDQLPLDLASEETAAGLREALGADFERLAADVPDTRPVHKETVRFYKRRKTDRK